MKNTQFLYCCIVLQRWTTSFKFYMLLEVSHFVLFIHGYCIFNPIIMELENIYIKYHNVLLWNIFLYLYKIYIYKLYVLSHFSHVWPQPTRLLCPWDFPGKNIGVGSLFSSRGSSRPRDQICVSSLQAGSLPSKPLEKADKSYIL